MSQDQPPSQAVKSYAGGIAARDAEREAARRAQGPVFPNLAEAELTYKPADGYKTLAQMGEEQRQDAPLPEHRGLSPQTVAGLQELHASEQAAQQARASEPQPPPPASPPASSPPKPPDDGEEPEYDDQDLAFARALEEAKKDLINNDQERKAVASRVTPIDLGQGLLTGEFIQSVPVVPGALVVEYRCLAAGENQDLRIMLFEELEKDTNRARLAGELLGLYQTVAMTMAINSTRWATHMSLDGATGRMVFQRKIFAEKLAAFLNFPLPLIASLSTHSAWFEQRVRELFVTTDIVKNG